MNEYTTMAIINVTAITGFVVLSVYFEKWWIVLFSILFLVSVKKVVIPNEGKGSN